MPFITFLLLFVASFLLQNLLRPKPNIENARPAGIGDFSAPTATEGRVVPIVWGRVKIAGPNTVWYGDLTNQPIQEKVKTGLFSSDKITKGFRYNIGLQFALCRGPIDNLVRIWVDEEEVYNTPISSGAYSIDEPILFGGEGDGTSGGGGLVGSGILFQGTETQAVSSYLSSFQSLQPAYRGTCYLTWENGYVGNQPNLRPWAFEVERYPNGLAVTNVGEENINNAANPMCVLYEILTNSEWGLNISSSSINTSSLRTSATTLVSELNGFAFIWDQQKDVAEIINEIERQVDGFLFIDPLTGNYDFKMVRFDYNPSTLDVIDETNIIDFNSMSRSAWDETINVIRARYSDPRKGYNEGYALAQDMANAQITQALNIVSVSFPGCKDKTLANSLAWRELRQLSYPIAKFTLVLNRTQFDIVQGDVRSLSWPPLGISNVPVRATKVGYGNITNGEIRVDFSQDIFTTEPGSFTPPIDTSWVAPELIPSAFSSVDQIAVDAPFIMIKQSDATPNDFPRVLTMATSPGTNNSNYDIRSREAATTGTQTGNYTSRSGVFTSVLTSVGVLRSALVGLDNALPLQGVGDFAIDPIAGDTLDALIGDSYSEADINSFVLGVGVIDPDTANEEWIIIQSIIDDAGGIQLENVYRGALDSLPKAHASGDRVWLTWVGGAGLSDVNFDITLPFIDLKLVPSSGSGETLVESSAIAFEIQLNDEERYALPLAPQELQINTDRYPTTVDATYDTDPGAPYIPGMTFEYLRRQWRQEGAFDSVTGLDIDGLAFTGSSLLQDNLRYFWWAYDLETTPNPTSRAQAFLNSNTDASPANDTFIITRQDIINNTTGGIVPDRMRIEIAARHTPQDMPVVADTESLEALIFDYDVTPIYNGTMNVGTDGSNLRGFRDATHPTSQFGTLSPSTVKGLLVLGLNGDTGTNLVVLELGAAGNSQISGINDITVRFDTGATVVLTWNGGTTQYEATDATATSYLAANVGNNVTVVMT